MKAKLDLKREVSAPCWAWKHSRGIEWDHPTLFRMTQVKRHAPDSGRPIIVRVITERAWRQIRRKLAAFDQLDQAAERLLKPKGKR